MPASAPRSCTRCCFPPARAALRDPRGGQCHGIRNGSLPVHAAAVRAVRERSDHPRITGFVNGRGQPHGFIFPFPSVQNPASCSRNAAPRIRAPCAQLRPAGCAGGSPCPQGENGTGCLRSGTPLRGSRASAPKSTAVLGASRQLSTLRRRQRTAETERKGKGSTAVGGRPVQPRRDGGKEGTLSRTEESQPSLSFFPAFYWWPLRSHLLLPPPRENTPPPPPPPNAAPAPSSGKRGRE